MGKLFLCWATVLLWVRVALNKECQIGEEEVLACVVCVDNRHFWKDSEARVSFCSALLFVWWISILKAWLHQETAR